MVIFSRIEMDKFHQPPRATTELKEGGMFWIKVILDWSSIGCNCGQCGDILTSGKVAYLLLDNDMKITNIWCSRCFHASFPEGY